MRKGRRPISVDKFLRREKDGTLYKAGAMDPTEVKHALIDELWKISADLSEHARAQLPKKDFALTAKQSDTGKPAYPIQDESHARAALGFVGMHGTLRQKQEVYRDIAKKYPHLAAKSSIPALKGMLKDKVKEGDFSAPQVPGPSPALTPQFKAPSIGGTMGGMGPKLGSAKEQMVDFVLRHPHLRAALPYAPIAVHGATQAAIGGINHGAEGALRGGLGGLVGGGIGDVIGRHVADHYGPDSILGKAVIQSGLGSAGGMLGGHLATRSLARAADEAAERTVRNQNLAMLGAGAGAVGLVGLAAGRDKEAMQVPEWLSQRARAAAEAIPELAAKAERSGRDFTIPAAIGGVEGAIEHGMPGALHGSLGAGIGSAAGEVALGRLGQTLGQQADMPNLGRFIGGTVGQVGGGVGGYNLGMLPLRRQAEAKALADAQQTKDRLMAAGILGASGLGIAAMHKESSSILERMSSGAAAHKAELAGLGVLGGIGADRIQAHARAGKGASEEDIEKKQLLGETGHALTDVAGLGILAAPSIAHLVGHK